MTHDVIIVLLTLLTTYSDATCQVTNCAQCIDNSEYVCDSCNDGFWLESGECKQCLSHCSRCTHSSQCQSCVTSHWNPGQSCNSVCSSNCSDKGCNDTTAYCYECQQGKYGQLCEEDCSQCVNGKCDLKQCRDGCIDGYVQENRHGSYKHCSPCSSNCIKCSNTTYCTQCMQGFFGYLYINHNGRGTMMCKQCLEQCTKCTSTDNCLECKPECIRQGCDVLGDCVTTRSTTGTNTLTTERIHQVPDTSPTETSLCPKKCNDNCDTHGACYTTAASNSKHVVDYYEAFGHGIATGIGILIVVGTLVGVVIFLTRRTNCLRTTCPTTCSRENHMYINTQEEAGTMPSSRNRPLRNEVNKTSDMHVTLSVEDAETNREYVSLGERQPENPYSDLQTTRCDDQ